MATTRYSKVSRRVWTDEKFRALSKAPPNAQTLWIRFLTGPELTCIPGVFSAWEAGLAQSLGWPLEGLPKPSGEPSPKPSGEPWPDGYPHGYQEGFRGVFREVAAKGLAKADWDAGLVWLPHALFHNPPENPNVVRSWRTAWEEMPECQLKAEIRRHFKAYGEGLAEGFQKAFREVFGEPYPQPYPKPSPHGLANQEQEQEQEQEGGRARAPDPSTPEPEHQPPARPTGYDLQRLFGRIRSEVFPNKLPWSIPPDKDGRTGTFAARLSDADITDTPATMRLALEHIRDGVEGWNHQGLSGPAFAFGSWRSKFTELREELAGLIPVPLRPRNTNGGGVEYEEFK